jgi:hypothetical protein
MSNVIPPKIALPSPTAKVGHGGGLSIEQMLQQHPDMHHPHLISLEELQAQAAQQQMVEDDDEFSDDSDETVDSSLMTSNEQLPQHPLPPLPHNPANGAHVTTIRMEIGNRGDGLSADPVPHTPTHDSEVPCWTPNAAQSFGVGGGVLNAEQSWGMAVATASSAQGQPMRKPRARVPAGSMDTRYQGQLQRLSVSIFLFIYLYTSICILFSNVEFYANHLELI